MTLDKAKDCLSLRSIHKYQPLPSPITTGLQLKNTIGKSI